jgi:class 3 adenylate cyclase
MAGLTDLSQHLNQQKFPADLEVEFQREFFSTSLRTHRTAIITAIVAFFIFELLDLGQPPDVLARLTVVRFGVVVPILLLLFALSFLRFYSRIYDWSASAGIAVTGLGVMAVQLIVDPPGFSVFITSLLLIIITGYTLARLRYRYALGTGWFLLAVFVLVSVWLESPVIFMLISAAMLVVANVIGMLAAFFTEQYLRRDFLQRRMLEIERARSEQLLLNILPTPVAERLKRGELIADSFSEASVLFADIVDFTLWSANRPPEAVLEALNVIFSCFDALAEKHGLEKIKTVGDAYMVVSGLPIPRTGHAEAIAEMALDILDELRELPQFIERPFQIRVGINCGPVVAGVIGSKKFIYDLWGDTVNIASRMEMLSSPGKIQASEAMYLCLREKYLFEERGQVTVKGRGEMKTYWLVGRKP